MPSWRTRLLIVLLLALVSVPSVPVFAEDDSTGASGFVFLEIDGLSEPGLRAALEAGAMPFLGGLIDDGSHTLGSWRTTAATTTTVTQAGLLHGHWRGIPGFRWWDRETGQPFDLLDLRAVPAFRGTDRRARRPPRRRRCQHHQPLCRWRAPGRPDLGDSRVAQRFPGGWCATSSTCPSSCMS